MLSALTEAHAASIAPAEPGSKRPAPSGPILGGGVYMDGAKSKGSGVASWHCSGIAAGPAF